jgi:type VI secretion system lysozyme-like protein
MRAPIRPSVFDRLLPGAEAQAPLAGLLRDLGDLLNTRLDRDVPRTFPEVRRSVARYGLPDLGSFEALAPSEQTVLCRAVTEAIERFEPRLRRVQSTWGGGAGDTAVIHVEAELVSGAGRVSLAVGLADGRLLLRTARLSVPPAEVGRS